MDPVEHLEPPWALDLIASSALTFVWTEETNSALDTKWLAMVLFALPIANKAVS